MKRAASQVPAAEAIARLDDFGAIIDARSEGEYAEDHLPGALNWPSLNDEERKLIGTLYKQVSPFEAQKRGAALVAANIARHIEREVIDKPRSWQPLVYCWRGGKRSGSLALVLGQIGFKVQRHRRRLQGFPHRGAGRPARTGGTAANTASICGPTGSGKTRLLQALAQAGAQVLDLEALASHRSSVLGMIPGQPQPTQKRFDTLVWDQLRRFDPARPVFVESESRKVGNLAVPDALIERMRASPCLRLELPDDERVALLLEDYDFFVQGPDALLRAAGRADRSCAARRWSRRGRRRWRRARSRPWCASCCSSTTTRAMQRRSRATSGTTPRRKPSRRRTGRRRRWPSWRGKSWNVG